MSDIPSPNNAHTWQLEELADDASLAEIQEALSRYNRAWKLSKIGDLSPRAVVGSRLIGDVLLTNMQLSGLKGERDEELVSQEQQTYIGLTCPYEGATVVHVDGEEFLLDTSKIQIWTSNRPVDFTADKGIKFVCILFPEERLYKRIPGYEGIPLLFDAKLGEVQLIKSHLLTLARICETSDGFDENCVSEATIELLANLLRSSNQFSVANSHKETLWEDLCGYIHDHLADHDLKPAALADQLGMSVRNVHKYFEVHDTTVMRYIKEQRLQAAKADLEDPFLEQLSITDICYKWAFSDAAHFSHAFKKRYGVSPSEFRRNASKSTG